MTIKNYEIPIFTALALIAFAGNSVLARLALIESTIGAWEFTATRLLSGAIVLLLIVGPKALHKGSWVGATALLGYAGLFSFAYLALDTGMGALLLFGAVQISMIGWGVWRGERLGLWQWVGVIAAVIGLVGLLLPGVARPTLWAAAAMLASGFCWGLYSLLGRTSADTPLVMTAGNFTKASVLLVLVTAVLLFIRGPVNVTAYGTGLAIISGALTSGLGYAIWYRALRGLTAMRAGIVQLAVPPLAALFGIALLGESLTGRFIVASLFILFGIALAIKAHPSDEDRKSAKS